MNRAQLEHLIRASANIVGDHQLIVIGSQSVLGKFPEAPAELLFSMEADLFAKNKRKETDKLEAIGEGSDFHQQNGYYADPVDENTAILPRDWKARLINVETYSVSLKRTVTGFCLDPNDLFIAKIAAGRDKDIAFAQSMIEHNMVSQERVTELAKKVVAPEDDPLLGKRITTRIAGLFARVPSEMMTHINEISGQYTGTIISKSESIVQQDIGRDVIKVHEARKLTSDPELGKSYTIQYKNGLGVVTEKVHERDQDLSR